MTNPSIYSFKPESQSVQRRTKFYVAGPMRGYDCFNFPAFDRVARELRLYGYGVVNPAEIDRELGFDETQNDLALFDALGGITAAMHRDFGAILECDGVVLLPGWQQSSGARAEVFIAETTGRQVYEWEDRYEDDVWTGFFLNPVVDTGIELVKHEPDAEHSLTERAVLERPDGAGGFAEVRTGPTVVDVEWTGPNEVRIVNETTGGQKGSKLARYDLIPAGPLHTLAEHYGRGSLKYADRNWELGYDWSLSFAALNRHLWAFWGGEDIDPETGSPHLAAVAWHAFALLEWGSTHPDLDNRPQAGRVAGQSGTLADRS